jgi:DNA-3-methyladenine glycosylase I
LKDRCPWAGDDPLYQAYHDEEWGVPVHDDRTLFEFLILEGAQAGLSWLTILRKRPNYRRAYSDFEPERVAAYTARERARLLRDPGIVRNRRKVEASVANARAFVLVQREYGSFDRYLWAAVGGRSTQNRFQTLSEIPARTTESEVLSRDLKGRGFGFVGPTICYAFMQAVGLVNDHLVSCPRHADLGVGSGSHPPVRSHALR